MKRNLLIAVLIAVYCGFIAGCGDTNITNGNEISVTSESNSDQTSDNKNLIEKGECVDCSEAAQAAQDKMWEFLMASFNMPETADAVYVPPAAPDSQDISIAFEIYLDQTTSLENGGDPVEISNGFEDTIESLFEGQTDGLGGATV